jgi:AAA domain
MVQPQRRQQAPQPRWLEELIGIVRLLCPAQKSPGRQDTTGEHAGADTAKRRGPATPDEERGAGWFSVPLVGQAFESDQLEAAYLAPREGGHTHKFQLIETVHDGNVLRVRAAEHAPRSGLFLWIPDPDTGRLYMSLLEGLSSSTQFNLIDRIAGGHANPVPVTRPGEEEGVPDLNDGQRDALRACLAPGVHLVWGPPGTGKTQVISRALRDLMGAGKSVLLVMSLTVLIIRREWRNGRPLRNYNG